MKDNGGFAYPISDLDRVLADPNTLNRGMTLRQWYKGMVIQGLLGGTTEWRVDLGKGKKRTPLKSALDYCKFAANIADALIAEDREAEK